MILNKNKRLNSGNKKLLTCVTVTYFNLINKILRCSTDQLRATKDRPQKACI